MKQMKMELYGWCFEKKKIIIAWKLAPSPLSYRHRPPQHLWEPVKARLRPPPQTFGIRI